MQVFEKTSAEGGRLRASIDRADALAADNTAWAILPRRARQKVKLVTPGNLFLEKVFEAIPLVDLEVVKVTNEMPVPGALARAARQALANSANSAGISVFPSSRCPRPCRAATSSSSSPKNRASCGSWVRRFITRSLPSKTKIRRSCCNIRLDNVLMPEARKLTLRGAIAGAGRVGMRASRCTLCSTGRRGQKARSSS